MMSILHKEYHKLPENAKSKYAGGEIKMTVVYNKDRVNWATSRPQDIGYRVSVIPIKRTNKEGYTMEESGAFTGFLDTLLSVDRQSKKRLQAAIDILHNNIDKYLQYFIETTETI